MNNNTSENINCNDYDKNPPSFGHTKRSNDDKNSISEYLKEYLVDLDLHVQSNFLFYSKTLKYRKRMETL